MLSRCLQIFPRSVGLRRMRTDPTPRYQRSSAARIQNDHAYCPPILEHPVRFGRLTKAQHRRDVGTNCAVERVSDEERERLVDQVRPQSEEYRDINTSHGLTF